MNNPSNTYFGFSRQTEAALAYCGRENVMANDREPFAVAIKIGPIQLSSDRWIQKSAQSHDTAGREAALAYAVLLEANGRSLNERAALIRKALNEERP